MNILMKEINKRSILNNHSQRVKNSIKVLMELINNNADLMTDEEVMDVVVKLADLNEQITKTKDGMSKYIVKR